MGRHQTRIPHDPFGGWPRRHRASSISSGPGGSHGARGESLSDHARPLDAVDLLFHGLQPGGAGVGGRSGGGDPRRPKAALLEGVGPDMSRPWDPGPESGRPILSVGPGRSPEGRTTTRAAALGPQER